MGKCIDSGLLTPDSPISLGGLSLNFVRKSTPSSPSSSDSSEPAQEGARAAQSDTDNTELEDVKAEAIRGDRVRRATALRESRAQHHSTRNSTQQRRNTHAKVASSPQSTPPLEMGANLKQTVVVRQRISVEVTAYWGNDDAESTIKISRRRWQAILDGADYTTTAWSWYEGKRHSVAWSFANGGVSIDGKDGGQCVVDQPVSTLVARIAGQAE